MRTTARRLTSTLAVVLLIVGCTSDAGDDAAPEEDGPTTPVVEPDEVRGEGDVYTATIRRDGAGVPHITGASLADVSFGQGWASGEDRTCDLADQVIKVKGERARWLGPGEDDANITSDVAWRAIGIAEVAAADWEEIDTDLPDLITAFTEGWNAHLADVGADGIDDWCAGEDWVQELEPVDVYTYARAIAL